MYTIVACTNREGSNSLKIAKIYQQYLKEEGIEAALFSMQDITMTHRNAAFEALEKKYLLPTQKFIFIVPEYNGSFPGIMKLMIDMSDIKPAWNDKKILLTGIAAGRAGNLRGLDVLTNMCNYMKMDVFHNKIPISGIHQELKDDAFANEQTIEAVKNQIKGFIAY